MKLSIMTQIGLLFAMLALVVFSETALVYQYQSETEQFGLFANLIGQQTFLSQRLALLAERVLRGGTGDRGSLRDIIRDVDETVGLLEEGGYMGGHRLPAAPEHVRGAVREHRRIWNELQPILLGILTNEGPVGDATESRVRTLTSQFTDSSYRLDGELENWRAELRTTLRHSSVASSVLAILIVAAAIGLTWRQFFRPLEKIRAEVTRAVHKQKPQETRSDISAVVDMVSEMTADVGRLRSEREEVEEELRHVEEDYRAIFLNAVAGILQISVDGRIRAANPALATILGYDSVTDLLMCVNDAHRQLFTDPRHETLLQELSESGGGVLQTETSVQRKDGSTLWVLESISMASRDAESSPYYEGVLVDITPRKKAEESLRELSGMLLRSQEEERRRIGRELHDSTGQLLAALSMNLDRLHSAEERLSPSEKETLTGCTELADQCSREIRSVSHLLHPPLLEELGLEYALRDYVEGFNKRSGIKVDIDLDGELERLPPDTETALFRFVQEALTNIHRHSGSPRAAIQLMLDDDEIRLEVRDEGRGLPPEVYDSAGGTFGQLGVGLRGMRERLKQLGGRLTIESSERGSRVGAILPRRNESTVQSVE